MAPHYTVILFDSERRVRERLTVTCPDDISAYEEARRRAKGRAMQIWQGETLLTEIKPDGEADLETLHRRPDLQPARRS